MHRHLAVLMALLVSAPLVSAQSDSVVGWPVGSRVRVWTAAHRHVVGELSEVRGDTLIITKTGMSRHQWRLHADSTQRVEISRGQYVSAERVVGGALGGAAASLLMYVLMDNAIPDWCTGDGCSESDPDYFQTAAIGAAVGAALGAMRLADRWEDAPKPVRVSIAPTHRQARVALSLAFR